ncbi:cupin domain-containing protein [Pseudomonas sp. G11]|uniref:cupin domain-containing protein n=1 Tax=Pseudomonas sp. G11 TaxID=528343 RepID=UPI0024029D81|nr:cupin domain-containing protein [Pseudomonas sp. G11]WEX18110.1 cupin domain-containing protein [Pseudomonas sp. G11]
MRLDQRNQAFPGHDLIHLNQETLTAGLLTFACVLGISERHLLHRGSTVQFVGQPYLTRFGSLFQSFLSELATLIEGEIEITDESGNSVTYEGGDGRSWFIRKGATVIWDVKSEKARKSFFSATTDI